MLSSCNSRAQVNVEFHEAVALAQAKRFDELTSSEQLMEQREAGRVFAGFEEAPIAFPPTYRCMKASREFSNKRSQSPSYCDRVLYKCVKPPPPAAAAASHMLLWDAGPYQVSRRV